MSTSGNGYEKVARQTLTNDETGDTSVIQFISSVFSLADHFSNLEADIAEHSLNYMGLFPGGLEILETQFQSLSVRFADIQRVISDPDAYLDDYIDGEVGPGDATRLREAVHAFGDLDRVLEQIRDAQSRLASEIAAKRSELKTTRGLFISLVSALVATLALGTTVATNTLCV